ncbi:MAG: ATP-binding protein [Gemmataceae bacterium]|nr:ATP-binding protein [Gemmataceae bacterium]
MQLISVRYTEFEGTDQEWKLEELTLGPINLLVGKNASGKSRSLNIIGSLARNLSNERKPGLSSHYDVSFDHQGTRLRYRLKVEDHQVQEEQFWIDGELKMDRGQGREGLIWTDQRGGGTMFPFQPPQDELAVVTRRDAIQHPYLQPLYEWGASLRHYYFGSQLGKDRLAVFVEKGGLQLDDKDANAVVALFKKGEKDLGNPYKEAVIADMARLDYPLDNVIVAPPVSIRISGAPAELVGLTVKESGLRGVTDQHSMSQGMFRTLSLIIQVNYAQMKGRATCLLIDDIGEGLDFDRSCRLIGLLREKAKKSSIQLIMSTNDRFVMNKVPLDEWSVLQRQGSTVRVRNYSNSKELFDEFKFTGLSNFDFLATDFANEEAAIHEEIGGVR